MTDQPSPQLFFRTLRGVRDAAMLKAAVDLGLFSAIGQGSVHSQELATTCKASQRGVRILCDYLTVLGFLLKEEDRYALTKNSRTFLDSASPAYLGGVTEFMLSDRFMEYFDTITEAVRKGGTAASAEGTVGGEDPIWTTFARVMMPMMRPVSEDMAAILDKDPDQPLAVIDIAAGHGIFGISLALRNPKVEVTAVDWAGVLQVAQENARALGVAERYRLLPGSAFDVPFEGPYDLALLTNFLHHFDDETNVVLLAKVRDALAEEGRAAILDFVPNADRISPPEAATFSAVMLATTPRGDAYTYRELDDMCRRAGFSGSELHELAPSPQRLIIAVK